MSFIVYTKICWKLSIRQKSCFALCFVNIMFLVTEILRHSQQCSCVMEWIIDDRTEPSLLSSKSCIITLSELFITLGQIYRYVALFADWLYYFWTLIELATEIDQNETFWSRLRLNVPASSLSDLIGNTSSFVFLQDFMRVIPAWLPLQILKPHNPTCYVSFSSTYFFLFFRLFDEVNDHKIVVFFFSQQDAPVSEFFFLFDFSTGKEIH